MMEGPFKIKCGVAATTVGLVSGWWIIREGKGHGTGLGAFLRARVVPALRVRHKFFLIWMSIIGTSGSSRVDR